MEKIKQHKKEVAIGLLAFLLLCCSCLFVAAVVQKPVDKTIVVTAVPTVQVTTPVATDKPTVQPTNTIAPTNTPQPTKTPVPTPTVDQVAVYELKLGVWSRKSAHYLDVFIALIKGENISKSQFVSAFSDLKEVRAEVRSYTPPQKYVEFHVHYTNAIDDIYDATVALSEGRIEDAVTLMEQGTAEINKAKELLPADSTLQV